MVGLIWLTVSAGAVWSADERPSPLLTRDSLFTEVGFITGFGYSTVMEGITSRSRSSCTWERT